MELGPAPDAFTSLVSKTVSLPSTKGLIAPGPMPMFPLLSMMAESPIVEEPVNLAIVFVVPLPVTVWALAPTEIKPVMANNIGMRFMVNLLLFVILTLNHLKTSLRS
jgi:hypothetical protein